MSGGLISGVTSGIDPRTDTIDSELMDSPLTPDDTVSLSPCVQGGWSVCYDLKCLQLRCLLQVHLTRHVCFPSNPVLSL